MANRIELTEEQIHLITKALADPRRYEILKRLGECEKGLACEAVREAMDVSAATLSHHMKELETAGLIAVVRTGKFAHYFPRTDVLNAFLQRLRADLL